MVSHFFHPAARILGLCTLLSNWYRTMHFQINKLSRFALVGGAGFLIDSVTMLLLYGPLPPSLARAVAIWTAASSNWYCNRRWTFSGRCDAQKARQYRQFLVSSAISFVPNWGISLQILLLPRPAVFELLDKFANPLWILFAMAPGVLAGMLINYWLSDRWVFAQA